MSVYRRGNTWWYSFIFCGQHIQESAKTQSKTVAKEAEKKRRRELEEGYHNIIPEDRNRRILTLAKAAEEYQEQYAARNSKNSLLYSKYCIKHLTEQLGAKMLIEITDHAVIAYQQARLREGTTGKTINEEVGELFRIMGEFGEAIRLKLRRAKKLTQREDVGRALTPEEEQGILREARASQSPYIYTAVMIALHTGMRDAEIRHVQWRQIDFFKQILTVGKSKTPEGTGRTVPLNSELLKTLVEHQAWYRAKVGSPNEDHFVFAGGASNRYDPTRPVTTFQIGWSSVRRRAKVSARFHDLRHTLITKLCETGAGDETVRGIAGHMSRRMLSRYAHIRTEAKRRALESLVRPAEGVPVKPAAAVEAPESVTVN